MFLLKTMTGADPETRWVLVQWVAKHTGQIWKGDYKELPGFFGVSKKSFDRAITYLVREGYLGRSRKQKFSITNAKKHEHFEYYVTKYSEEYWRQSLPNESSTPIPWDKQMFSLLFNTHEQTQIAMKMTVAMRLVMLFLYSKADLAGYVVLPEAGLIKKTLGMTKLEFSKTVKKLVDIQELKFLSEELEDDFLIEGVNQICLISRRPCTWRTIKCGLVSERDSLIPVLLDDLYKVAFKANSHLVGEICSRYFLPKEQFKELALSIKSKKLHIALRHLCLRTLFALIPNHEIKSILNQYENKTTETVNPGIGLRPRIVEKLFEVLAGEQELRQALLSGCIKSMDVDDSDKHQNLKFWMFNEIILDLENTIFELSKQFTILAKSYNGPVHLIGWLHRQKMKAKLPEDGPNPPHKVLVGRVLEVLIVEKQSCHDVVLVDQELLAADKDLD